MAACYPERGRLKVSEASVDPSTGSVVLRAVFPNPRRELLPGMFVRAQLAQGTRSAALLVPQRGVSHNPRGEATVLIVDKDDKVAERVVTADRAIAGRMADHRRVSRPAIASSSTDCRRPSRARP